MVGGDLYAECVLLPVYTCGYTFAQRAAQSMALMPDPRCGFENQGDVEFPMYYAKPHDGPFSTYYTGDKGFMPSFRWRQKWPSNRDCGDFPPKTGEKCDGTAYTDDAANSCAGWIGATQQECQAYCDDDVQASGVRVVIMTYYCY